MDMLLADGLDVDTSPCLATKVDSALMTKPEKPG